MRALLFLSIYLLLFRSLYAQDVNVDHFTGQGYVTIPIHTVTSGSLAFPIRISNSLSSLTTDMPTGKLGLGWSFSGGGSINRSLKGLPDDYFDNGGVPNRIGWLRNNTNLLIGNFNSTSDESLATVTEEKADHDFLQTLGGFSTSNNIVDTEPDEFYVNVPGYLSTSFVFDNSGQVKFFDEIKYKCEVSKDVNDEIVAFKIVDDNGITFSFGRPTRFTIESNSANPTQISHFSRNYFLYLKRGTKTVQYNSNWKLLSIENIAGDRLLFDQPLGELTNLGEGGAQSFNNNSVLSDDTDSVEIWNGLNKKLLYTIKTSWTNVNSFTSVIGDNQIVKFNYGTIILPDGEYKLIHEVLNNIQIFNHDYNTGRLLNSKKNLKQFDFKYRFANGPGQTKRTHVILESLIINSSSVSSPPIIFQYNGVTNNPTSPITAEILLWNRYTNKKDVYGYHADENVLSGYKSYFYQNSVNAERSRYFPGKGYNNLNFESGTTKTNPSLALLTVGLLSRVKTSAGGFINIQYELNEYYDSLANSNLYGGGVRIKQIDYSDGVSNENDFSRKFEYARANNSNLSSGVLACKPEYTLILPYSQDLNSLTKSYPNQSNQVIHSVDPLNDFNQSWVVYSRISEHVTSKGKTIYEFDVSTKYSSSNFPNWQASKTKVARNSPTSTGVTTVHNVVPTVSNSLMFGFNTYPYASNPNFQFKTGNLLSITYLNENNQIVKRVQNTYSYKSPTKVFGLKLDRYTAQLNVTVSNNLNPNPYSYLSEVPMFLFTKYEVNTSTQSKLTQTTEYIYDLDNPIKFVQNTVSYFYDQDDYVPRRTVQTNSDGNEFINEKKFSKDYLILNIDSNLDVHTKAIKKLIELNNLFVPIEEISFKKIGSQSAKAIQSSISLFKLSEFGTPQLYRSLSYRPGMGSSSFSISQVMNNLNSSVFSFDSLKYDEQVTFKDFTSFNLPQSQFTSFKTKSASLFNQNKLQVLAISNALATEIYFNDFDNKTDFNFIPNSLVSGREETKGYELTTSQSLNFSIVKDNQQQYKISWWAKPGASGTITILASSGSNQVSKQVNVSASTSWMYYHTIIDLSSLANQVNIVISSNATIPIDDLIFYPYLSTFLTSAYNSIFQKIFETNQSGKTVYFEYDGLYRPTVIRDFSKNIIKTNTYVTSGNNFELPQFTVEGDFRVNQSITFKNNGWGNKDPNALCKWKIVKRSDYNVNPSILFDFASSILSSGNSLIHTAVENGEYLVNLQVTSGGITKVSSHTYVINITPTPLDVSLCANTSNTIDICNPITQTCTGSSTSNNLQITATATGGTGNYKYVWSVVGYYIEGGANYTYIGRTLNFQHFLKGNFTYKCEVTDLTSGANGVAYFLTSIYKSNPECTPPNQQ